jgi:hypothetical protein
MVFSLSGPREVSKPKLLDQVSDLTQGAKLDRENDLEIPRLRSE